MARLRGEEGEFARLPHADRPPGDSAAVLFQTHELATQREFEM